MKKKTWQKQLGFTLIEMLLYMGILSILIGVITTIFAQTMDMQMESESTSEVDQSGRYILMRLVTDIHDASQIISPAALGESTNTLTIQINGITYTYALDANNNFTVSDGTETFLLNQQSTQVSDVQFTRLGDDLSKKNTIKISYTVKSLITTHTGNETKVFNTTVGIR